MGKKKKNKKDEPEYALVRLDSDKPDKPEKKVKAKKKPKEPDVKAEPVYGKVITLDGAEYYFMIPFDKILDVTVFGYGLKMFSMVDKNMALDDDLNFRGVEFIKRGIVALRSDEIKQMYFFGDISVEDLPVKEDEF